MCDDSATLAFLADQACLTLHRRLSRTGRPDRPDLMVFELDLDPADDGFGAVREAARWLGGLLGELGLPATLMTTGSRGLHAVVPLDGEHDFDEVQAFARDTADLLAARDPEQLTAAARKKDRGQRRYLDVGRNAYAQTAVAPWTVADAADHARTRPWSGAARRGRALGPARRRLDALRGV